MSETTGRALSKELLGLLHTIRRRRDRLSKSAGDLPSGAEWLLDNWYLIEREGRLAVSELRGAGRLRSCLAEACRELVCETGGQVDAENAADFLSEYQKAAPLRMCELAVFAPCLRLALIEQIALAVEDCIDVSLLSACIGSIRLFASLDLTGLLEGADLVERELRRDPAGVYPLMDERSRAAYRERVRLMAKRKGVEELSLARRLVSGCGEDGHVGFLLFPEPKRGYGYVAAQLIPAAAAALLLGLYNKSIPLALLSFAAVWELAKSVCDFILLRALPPRLLPRLELADGVPDEGRCLCVVSSLLGKPEAGAELSRRLEEFMLSSRDCGENLMFGLLADLPEAKAAVLDTDAEAVDAAVKAVAALNEKYGGGFYLFCRERKPRGRDGVWCGFERKRGALLALARLLRGDAAGLSVLAGDKKRLCGVKYILTLDADTRLLPGSARELIGAMLHPVNAPQFDLERGVVVRGHGLIHPRMDTELSSAVKTPFSRFTAGAGGTDPYGAACGEVWMDLTGCGGFAGKGILDVDAFLTGCSRLPENLILSHDAVEGAILRGGYMSDTELTDGFPSNPFSYFKRLHRWVRGDWQNLGFIFGGGRNFAFADRWKLLDSLRRSLVPVFSLAAILWPLFRYSGASLIAGLLGLFTLCTGLLPMIGSALMRRDREKLSSSVPHGPGGRLLQILLRLALLPMEAAACLSAILTALWRMLISKRNLLSWQTAAQSEGRARRILGLWPPVVLGALLVALSPVPLGRAAGIFWLVSALLTPGLGREARLSRPLPEADRDFLLGEAAKIWQYFADFCTKDDNFLPPDNWQEQPPTGLAHRTSPTNIGLALVSALAAADLGLCSVPEMTGLVENILSSCEKMSKWHGHLYNWYDTRTLRPLHPRYISTVDSGNFAACLGVMRRGLSDYARPDLAARAAALYEAVDFKPLYDCGRRLFHIGWDADMGALSEGLYDLLSSEARLTGYLAIARGEVPRKHWRKLSRALVSKDGFRGMASWTGTMFEYLMPELFLPLCRDSLLWESARFCLYVQRKDSAEGEPWGQSESAFYSLDPQLNYRYKAHGCAALALKRGMEADKVISPYSSFLALAVEPRAAVRNLRRLCSLGFTGRYGLWEAVDYTRSRTSGRGGESVRCVMAHHLGMSLAAIANCLEDNVMCRRFMSDPAMSAHRCLLEERLPIGAVTIRRRGADIPEKPNRLAAEGWELGGACPDAAGPVCCPISNGVYHLMLTSSGLSGACAGGVSVYRGPDSPLGGPAGLRLSLETASGRVDLLPLPGARGGLDFSYALRGGAMSFEGESKGLRTLCSAAVSARDMCEVRFVELSAKGALEGRLCLEFEPMLAKRRDWEGHPAYWRLGLEASVREGALLIRRLPRGDVAECWLCLSSNRPLEYRADLLGEPLGWLSHPYVRACARVSAPMSGSFTARFALSFGPTAEDALRAASRGLASAGQDFADLLSARAALMGMGARDLEAAVAMAAPLVFPTYPKYALRREQLWSLGISGDLPLICAGLNSESQLKAAGELIRRHDLLRVSGIKSDLVFVTSDGGDYLHRLGRSVMELLQKDGLESVFGARGGVHTAERSLLGSLMDSAALNIDLDEPELRFPEPASSAHPPLPEPRLTGTVPFSWLEDGAFEFDTAEGLPARAWTLPLTNGSFGALAADCGMAGMWLGNARECRVDRGLDGDLAASGSETLTLDGENAFLRSKVRFGFGFAEWRRGDMRICAFVPAETDARVMIIENAASELCWTLRPGLAYEVSDAAFVQTRLEDGALMARNPRGGSPDLDFGAAFSGASRLAAEEDGRPVFKARLGPGISVIACGFLSSGELHSLCDPEAARQLLDEARRRWMGIVGRVKTNTGLPEIDRYMNGWAVYQALACRLMARTSIYQSGGAYGFRDQLQDSVNLIPVGPEYAHERILSACAHQYLEGDVMHWWHEGSPDRGVRTRCSDDLVWLPWAVCEYVDKVGDKSILGETAPYLISEKLADSESSRYEAAAPEGSGTVLEHAALALRLVIRRGVGRHGLPLMLAGDWNDGMDTVGIEGRGESVWLAWFFAHTARRFAHLLEAGGDKHGAAALLSAASRLGRAADRAWDGQWYLRGYFDDGSPLGSGRGHGCRIDSVAQSWAAMCAEASPEKVNAALDSALGRLFDRENGLVRLFDPPFGEGAERAGYIASYGPGFRENGGQYTHGAIWLAMACLKCGRRDEGLEILKALLPKGTERYGAEPYVLAADVYSNPDRKGQAGWSWYTGSAGWFFRVVTEYLSGDG